MRYALMGSLLAVVTLAVTLGDVRAGSLPSGTQLLASAFATSQAKGSYHLQGSIVVGAVGIPLDRITIQGDISTKAGRASVVASTHAPTGLITVEERVLGKHLAVRTGNAKWSCSSMGSIVGFAQSLTGFARPPSAQTIGTGTVNGHPVWRVRALESIRILGATQRIPLTFLVAQSGHTLLRETATTTVHVSSARVQEAILFNFSRYGEAVKVSLPAACKA